VNIGEQLFYRVDMEDVSGTLFCERCGDAAAESGLFTVQEDDEQTD